MELPRSNPVNNVDPWGRWDILPGFTLSDGGMYGQGQITVPFNFCSGYCWSSTNANNTLSLFVPKFKNSKLYSDMVYIQDGHVYPAIESTYRCLADAFPLYIQSDDWITVKTITGKSNSFTRGLFADIANATAFGNGYQGPMPWDLTFENTVDPNWSIALRLYRSQGESEREQVNFVKIWEEAYNSPATTLMNGTIGSVSFLAQALSGVVALSSEM